MLKYYNISMSRKCWQLKILLYLLLALTIVISTSSEQVVASSPPNILFILVDDLGWHDVGFHGSEISTPNIDQLAYGGVILNNYYVQPVCTPTRGAILSGKYPIHTGLQHHVIVGAEPFGLPLTEKTLAQYLKELGYSTHIVGKWHVGFMSEDYLPQNRGFDSHFGFYTGHGDHFDHHSEESDFFGLDLHYNGSPVWNETEVYSTDIFTRHAKKVLSEHDKSKPLFLYLAYQGVHAGNSFDTLQAPQKYVDRFPYIDDLGRRVFAGAVSAVDDSVGEVLHTLHDTGLADNTLVVLSTDNGGATDGEDGNAGCNWPLRGNKNTLWQGGVRAIGLVNSPLLQRSGYVSEGMMHAVDWLPTLLDAALGPKFDPPFRENSEEHHLSSGSNSTSIESSASSDQKMKQRGKSDNHSIWPLDTDGVSVWSELSSGKMKGTWPRHEVLLNIDPILERGALIVGDLKLIYGPQGYDSWYPPPGVDNYILISDRSTSSSSVDHAIYTKNQHQDYETAQDTPSALKKSISRSVTGAEFSSTPRAADADKSQRSEPNKIIIECGPVPLQNASWACQPEVSACVFNLTSDPCEYHNLANEQPELLTELLSRLELYNDTAMPAANQPADPNGDPQLHGGVWQPWL